MLVFPNCKINLGLHVTEKRADGYHNIETVFYPVNWCDALELLPGEPGGPGLDMKQSGLAIAGNAENNLIYKAWQLLQAQTTLTPLKVFLHKTIPMGAGLGGGSADAAFFINLVCKQFHLSLSSRQKQAMASELGSDCAFFIENTPVFATGRGNIFSPIRVNLDNYFILVVYPAMHSNTRDAYNGLVPAKPVHNLVDVIEKEPLQRWKDLLVNDFEKSIFLKYPEIAALKQNLYTAGAVYASMSGSGSAVFGIFDKEPPEEVAGTYSFCLQKPVNKIL